MPGSYRTDLKLLLLLAAALGLALSSGCFKKGKGEGTRLIRPNASGTIFDDGDKNQIPEETEIKDEEKENPDGEMDPEIAAILAACFKIDVEEVQPVPGWTNKEEGIAAANALCAQLEKTKYKDGIAGTAEPVEIE